MKKIKNRFFDFRFSICRRRVGLDQPSCAYTVISTTIESIAVKVLLEFTICRKGYDKGQLSEYLVLFQNI